MTPPKRNLLRAVLYTRVSFDRKGRARSVEQQAEEARTACEENSWTITRELSDNDRSASRFARKDRPEYAELLELLESGTVDVLVLWEPSRGDREAERWLKLLRICRENGVLIHVCTHDHTYDLKRPKDWKSLAQEGVESQSYSEEASLRQRRNTRAAARAGRPHGKLLYGYRREYDPASGDLVGQHIRDDQAEVIQEAARRFADGDSCYEIAADFNARGVRTPRYEPLLRKADQTAAKAAEITDEAARQAALDEAKKLRQQAAGLRWDLTQVGRLVTNPAYAGQRVHLGQIVSEAQWPAILDDQVYADCVARHSDPRRKSVRDTAVKHLLSGAARCHECDAPARVQKNRTILSYICSEKFCVAVKKSALEDFIVETVLARLSRPDALDLIVGTVEQPADDPGKLVKKLEARLDTFYAEAAADRLSAQGLAAIEAQLLPQLEAARAKARPTTVSPLLRKLAGPGAAERWEELTPGQRREVVVEVVEIRISKGRRGAKTFDPGRLGQSRWRGDSRTWAEIWGTESAIS